MAIVRPLTTTGPSANRVDLIVMGDGYTSSEIATTYASHVSGLLSYLFDGSLLTQPFARYRSFFNVFSTSYRRSPAQTIREPASFATPHWALPTAGMA